MFSNHKDHLELNSIWCMSQKNGHVFVTSQKMHIGGSSNSNLACRCSDGTVGVSHNVVCRIICHSSTLTNAVVENGHHETDKKVGTMSTKHQVNPRGSKALTPILLWLGYREFFGNHQICG